MASALESIASQIRNSDIAGMASYGVSWSLDSEDEDEDKNHNASENWKNKPPIYKHDFFKDR